MQLKKRLCPNVYYLAGLPLLDLVMYVKPQRRNTVLPDQLLLQSIQLKNVQLCQARPLVFNNKKICSIIRKQLELRINWKMTWLIFGLAAHCGRNVQVLFTNYKAYFSIQILQPRTYEPRLLWKLNTFSQKVTVHKLRCLFAKEDSKS